MDTVINKLLSHHSLQKPEEMQSFVPKRIGRLLFYFIFFKRNFQTNISEYLGNQSFEDFFKLIPLQAQIFRHDRTVVHVSQIEELIFKLSNVCCRNI